MLSAARANGAPQEVMKVLQELPEEKFGGPQDVMKAYGSGVACLFLISITRQAALVISIVAMLVFAAGVASIRFATSLERAQRPPFVVFGLAALAVTLAHPLFIAIRSPRSYEALP